MSKARQINFEQAVYDAFGQVKDFTLAMRIARYFYEKAEKEIIEKAMRWIEWNSKNGGCIYDGWKDDFPKEMIENNEL